MGSKTSGEGKTSPVFFGPSLGNHAQTITFARLTVAHEIALQYPNICRMERVDERHERESRQAAAGLCID